MNDNTVDDNKNSNSNSNSNQSHVPDDKQDAEKKAEQATRKDITKETAEEEVVEEEVVEDTLAPVPEDAPKAPADAERSAAFLNETLEDMHEGIFNEEEDGLGNPYSHSFQTGSGTNPAIISPSQPNSDVSTDYPNEMFIRAPKEFDNQYAGGVPTVTLNGKGTGQLTINIEDHTPTAENNVETIYEIQENAMLVSPSLQGNLITDDDPGADGFDGVLSIFHNGSSYTNNSVDGKITITTALNGTFEIDTNGSYTYNLPHNLPQAPLEPLLLQLPYLAEKFDYTYQDGDGDTATATLTINILDKNAPIINKNPTIESYNVNGSSQEFAVSGCLGSFSLDEAHPSNPGNHNSGDYVDGGLGAFNTSGSTLTASDGSWTLVFDFASASYTFTQVSAFDHTALNLDNGDPAVGVFHYTLIDGDNSKTDGTLRVTIHDMDVNAKNDFDTVAEGSSTDGNVITGEDKNDPDTPEGSWVDANEADDLSVDTPNTISLISHGSTNHSDGVNDTDGAADNDSVTFYTDLGGTITFNLLTGAYTYISPDNVDNTTPVTEIFTYTIEDSDGSTDTATLTINITDTPSLPALMDKAFINEIVLNSTDPQNSGNDIKGVASPAGTENVSYIEIQTIFNNAVKADDFKGAYIEILGPTNELVIIDLETMVYENGGEVGNFVVGNGIIVFYEDGTWQNFSNNGNPKDWGYYRTDQADPSQDSNAFTQGEKDAMAADNFSTDATNNWLLGDDTTEAIAVNLVQNNFSIDLFVANNVQTSGFTADFTEDTKYADIYEGNPELQGVGTLLGNGDFSDQNAQTPEQWRAEAAWHGHCREPAEFKEASLGNYNYLTSSHWVSGDGATENPLAVNCANIYGENTELSGAGHPYLVWQVGFEEASFKPDLVGLLLGPEFLSNMMFNGSIGDQGELLTHILNADARADAAEHLPDPDSSNENHVFARVHSGHISGRGSPKDGDVIDKNQEDDWTTTEVKTEGDYNGEESINPQDALDDMNPKQDTGGANGDNKGSELDRGQNIIDISEGGPDNALALDEVLDDNQAGGRGPDFMYGDDGSNMLSGEGHNDFLFGGAGGDILNGDSGADLLVDVEGEDTLNGGSGNDTLIATHTVLAGWAALTSEEQAQLNIGGNDVGDLLFSGADLLVDVEGEDTLNGGSGNDTLIATHTVLAGWAALTSEEQAQLNIGGNDVGDLLFGNDVGDLLFGEDGDDVMFAGASDDYLVGGAGNDVMSGGAGNDVMSGGAGNDVMSGGAGNDVMSGGAGTDTFHFDVSTDTGNDTIIDFDFGEDILSFAGVGSSNATSDAIASDAIAIVAHANNGLDVTITLTDTDSSTITLAGMGTGSISNIEALEAAFTVSSQIVVA